MGTGTTPGHSQLAVAYAAAHRRLSAAGAFSLLDSATGTLLGLYSTGTYWDYYYGYDYGLTGMCRSQNGMCVASVSGCA